MKTTTIVLTLGVCSLLTVLLTAQVANSSSGDANSPPLSEVDRAWLDIKAAAFTPDFSAQLPDEPGARKIALKERADKFVRTADRAKDFYDRHPDHAKAAEARLVEVRALVAASQTGDASGDGRLVSAVQAVRGNQAIPASVRVQAVSAYAFPKAMREAKDRAGRLEAMTEVARGLAMEFPTEPQGAESLVNLALTSDEATARKLAGEVLAMPAPPETKQGAQALLGRLDLVGKSIAAEFDGANLASSPARPAAGRATIIYTWASWSPGSLRLAADLKKLDPPVNIVGLNLDEDTVTAKALAEKEGLVGSMIYDERGREGALAQRLGIRGAPQVIFIDAQGVVRDARGEFDLTKKLQSFGR